MKTIIIVLFLKLYLFEFVLCSVRTCTNPNNFNFLQRNKQIVSNDLVVEKLSDRGLVQCALECMLRTICKSFSFEYVSGDCSLFQNSTDDVMISDKPGTDISDIKDWPGRIAGPCENHGCSIYEVCEKKSVLEKTCVIAHCPAPPMVKNSTHNFSVSYETTKVGHRLSYKCDSKFIPVGERICQPNGTWSDFHCEKECYILEEGTTLYVGRTNTTINGTTCQRWDTQYPHPNYNTDSDFPDASVSEAENFCRDPGDDGYLWCFTTNVDIRWEICDIPPCSECYILVEGTALYVGRTNTAINGTTCQRWDKQSPHTHNDYTDPTQFPDASLSEADNFCRDPGGDGFLWCYTTNVDIRWEMCDIPPCPGS